MIMPLLLAAYLPLAPMPMAEDKKPAPEPAKKETKKPVKKGMEPHQLANPIDFDIPEESLTEIACGFASQSEVSHYHVWLPKGYKDPANAKRLYPVMIIDDAGGNSQNKWKQFEDFVKDTGYICVMPVEVKNGEMKPIIMHYNAILNDLPERFRLAPAAGLFTGCSGGSRRAGFISAEFSDYMGGVLHSAAVGINYCKEKHMFGAAVLGDHDYNIAEMARLVGALGEKRGYYRYFDGGHGWFTKEDGELALDWLIHHIGTRPKPMLADDQVKPFILHFKRLAEGSSVPLVSHLNLTRCNEILKLHPKLKTDPELSEFAAKLNADILKISQDPAFKKEWNADQAFQKAYFKTCVEDFANGLPNNGSLQSAAQKSSVRSLSEKLIKNALKALEKVAKDFPGTQAAETVGKEKTRLEKFPEDWK